MHSYFKTWQNIPASLIAGLIALYCIFLLGFAFVLETFVDLTPCPLCIAQRIFFFLIGVVAVAYLWWPKWLSQKWVGIKIIVLALLGGAIAVRQVWMQWYPHNIDPTRCGVTFGSFIDQFLQALGGTGDCAKVDWTLFTLSIAEWSALSFLVLLIAGFILFFRARTNREMRSDMKTYE